MEGRSSDHHARGECKDDGECRNDADAAGVAATETTAIILTKHIVCHVTIFRLALPLFFTLPFCSWCDVPFRLSIFSAAVLLCVDVVISEWNYNRR